MRPTIWGPILWNTMHIISLGYPDNPTADIQEAASSFYRSLTSLIPCPICREHYKNHLTTTPPATESKKALIEWVWMIHNKVNQDLGKSEISFDAFMQHMESLSDSPVSVTGMGIGIGVGIGVAALLYYIYKIKHT
jgi:hypothetical protein